MRVCSVPSFEATKFPITNGEYLKFVLDGGYIRRDLWSNEAWQWVQSRQARHPTFWICSNGSCITEVSSPFSFLLRIVN